MRRFYSLLTLLMMSFTMFASDFTTLLFEDLPFDMPNIEVSVFKQDTINILDFGARGDGVQLNTTFIQAAIDACEGQGGGVVMIPTGYFLSGPIELKSKVNLHLASGALLKFSPDKELYPIIWWYWEGQPAYRCQSPISAYNAVNIAITGLGVIDGTGEAWRLVQKYKVTENQWNKMVESGGVVNSEGTKWYPEQGSIKGEMLVNSGTFDYSDQALLQETKRYFRPVMISFVGCRRILLDGPTFQNSPAWNIHPLMCEHVTVRNINVRNPWYSQNGDGIDIESCNIGIITNCRFDVGDDAICIKSGRNKAGRDRAMPTQHFVITDNVVYRGHGGFVVGSEMSGGVRNIFVSNCTFMGTNCGLRFKSTRGRGGVVEKIWIEKIFMDNIPSEAIRFNLYYEGKSTVDDDAGDKSEESAIPVNEETPSFRDIFIKDIWATRVETAIMVRGLPEMPVKNIRIENFNCDSESGINCLYGENIFFDNLQLNVKRNFAIEIIRSANIVFNDLNAGGYKEKLAVVKGSQSKQISFKGKNYPIDIYNVLVKDVSLGEVKLY
jgi:DNA sulfur modification protein DndE